MTKPPKPPTPPKPKRNLLARKLAENIRQAHGVDSAATLDLSEEMGNPRGYIPTGNWALERALGMPGWPEGRLTEVSGWEGSGKSTMLDESFREAQKLGGLGLLADIERARNRAYMQALGVEPASLIWIRGKTVEEMFDEVETFVRTLASINAIAWFEALQARSKKKLSPLPTYQYMVFDPTDNKSKKSRKPMVKYTFSQWSRSAAAALMAFQQDHEFSASGLRTQESQEVLRPIIIHSDSREERDAIWKGWLKGKDHELIQAAGTPVLFGWDSVAGTASEAEMEGTSRDQHIGTAARAIRRNLRRLVQLIDDESVATILVNQRYEKIETGWQAKFSTGKKSETYGGGGIKYHSTYRVELTKIGLIYAPGQGKQQGFPPVGQEVQVSVPKNKLNDPFRVERYALLFGKGVCNGWAAYEDFKTRGIITAGGAWSKFTDPTILGGDNKSFQRGWVGLSEMIEADPALAAKLKDIYLDGGS